MKYMLMLFEPETDWEKVPKEQMEAVLGEHERFIQFLRERGTGFSGEALQPPSTATTLRRSGKELLVSDGPFVELKEHLGGFYVIDAKDLDEAIQIAKRCPTITATEIRPIWEIP